MKILRFVRARSVGHDTLNGVERETIPFESPKLEHLLVIGQYRVVNFPTSLIIDDKGKVLLRIKGEIPKYCLNSLSTAT